MFTSRVCCSFQKINTKIKTPLRRNLFYVRAHSVKRGTTLMWAAVFYSGTSLLNNNIKPSITHTAFLTFWNTIARDSETVKNKWFTYRRKVPRGCENKINCNYSIAIRPKSHRTNQKHVSNDQKCELFSGEPDLASCHPSARYAISYSRNRRSYWKNAYSSYVVL